MSNSNNEKSVTATTVSSILWLSRHKMTEDQFSDLQRIYGTGITVKQYDQSVKDWRDVAKAGRDCDVLAVVLPPAILGDLTNPHNNTKPVIVAESEFIPTGRMKINPATGLEEPERVFKHVCWKRFEKLAVSTQDLNPGDLAGFKNLFWLSRHRMTDVQSEDLKNIFGCEVNIDQFKKSVTGWKQIVELAKESEVLAVVLPPTILADLVNTRNNSKPVIRAKSARLKTGNKVMNLATGKEEPEFVFQHLGWELVTKVELVKSDL